jgi:ABC-2 type transport system ATP-binding protein
VAEDTPTGLQERLTGADRVQVKIKGDAKDLLPLVTPLTGVLSAEVKNFDELDIAMAAGHDVRPQIASTIVKNNFGLLEMKANNLSLEDIFMQLTQDEPSQPSLDGTVED